MPVRVAYADHREGFVQNDLVAAGDLGGVETRVQRHAHLAPRGEDVDRTVLVKPGEGTVDRRGLGQFLDFVAQGGDLIAGLLNRDGEFLVVRTALGELSSRLEELLFEHLDTSIGLFDFAEVQIPRGARAETLVVLITGSRTTSVGTVHTPTLGERCDNAWVTIRTALPLE